MRSCSAFPWFIATWGDALAGTQARLSEAPDEPGLVRSAANLVAAILRTVAGGAFGLLRGVLAGV